MATTNGRVLVVEDDPNQRILYERELRKTGYDVVTAADGIEALALCESAQPDVVVLDIGMPKMDGIDAMDRLLAKDHQLPIILHTAYPSYGDNYRSWSADAYVVKSSDLTELKQAIERLLKSRQHVA